MHRLHGDRQGNSVRARGATDINLVGDLNRVASEAIAEDHLPITWLPAHLPKTPTVLERLRERLEAADILLRKPEVAPGVLAMRSAAIRHWLEKVYGKDSPLLKSLPARGIDKSIVGHKGELTKSGVY